MSHLKIFISGSADGLGFLAAKDLLEKGHEVYLHARNRQRAEELKKRLPEAAGILIGDLAEQEQVMALAEAVNHLGKMDAILHNAGVYQAESSLIFKVNVLAPYMLSNLIELPRRLIYLSSSMHRGGAPLPDASKAYQISYSDSKFLITAFALAMARLHPEVSVNAVDPGWVPTKMGGAGAPDDLQKGYETQVWLAESESPEALISGRYLHHLKEQIPQKGVEREEVQNSLMEICQSISGVSWS